MGDSGVNIHPINVVTILPEDWYPEGLCLYKAVTRLPLLNHTVHLFHRVTYLLLLYLL